MGWKTERQGAGRQENMDDRGLEKRKRGGLKTGGWQTGKPGQRRPRRQEDYRKTWPKRIKGDGRKDDRGLEDRKTWEKGGWKIGRQGLEDTES